MVEPFYTLEKAIELDDKLVDAYFAVNFFPKKYSKLHHPKANSIKIVARDFLFEIKFTPQDRINKVLGDDFIVFGYEGDAPHALGRNQLERFNLIGVYTHDELVELNLPAPFSDDIGYMLLVNSR